MKFAKKLGRVIAAFVLSATLLCGAASCADGEDALETQVPVFKYDYSEKNVVTPFWLNERDGYTVVYNEIATPIRYGDEKEAFAYLAYEPDVIISVRDYTLQKEYAEGADYVVEGNKITVAADGSMPYIRDEWLDNKNIPDEFSDFLDGTGASYNDAGGTNAGAHVISEGSLTRTNHLCVTYAYKTSEQELGFDTPSFDPDKFLRFMNKVKAGEKVSILVFGDSIFTGASASSVTGFEPGLPAFFDLVRTELAARYYGGDESMISVVNESEGGRDSAWGAEQIARKTFDVSGFDLVMVGFGMNDGTLNVSPAKFEANIGKIVEGIREQSPDADFLVAGSFTPNPKSIFAGNHEKYIGPVADMYAALDGKDSGCTYLSMFGITTAILQNKQKNNGNDARYQYIDISSNYTNHPNDYTVRLYAGCMLLVICGF